MIYHGDSLEVLKTLEENSVDAVVTDPPYGLSFMGKKWDYDVPSKELWAEVLRVLKPGGHLLSFGGTRTYHRMVCAIEDAGFEIRDQVMWIYGSGFPKSLDVSKAIDKAAGAEREVVGEYRTGEGAAFKHSGTGVEQLHEAAAKTIQITSAATPAAKQWQGFGTALKPANEPIVLARKPLSESTVAKNVLKWGTGALNIDGGRIASPDHPGVHHAGSSASGSLNWNAGEKKDSSREYYTPQGRWPANVLFDESAAAMLDEQSGVSKSTGGKDRSKNKNGWTGLGGDQSKGNCGGLGDSGGASRFFYVAKASKRERNAGCEVNGHPTVKPIKLMEYLCKLITPPGGIILDPFCGSGSTGVAAVNLGFKFIGIEREKEYGEIAEKRIANARPDEELKEVDDQLCLSI